MDYKKLLTVIDKKYMKDPRAAAVQKKYQSLGAEGLAHGANADRLKEVKRLRKENEMLKQIIAEKELEGKLKDELIKKKYR